MKLFNKKSGVLLHITSLPSKYGIGDFGPQAYEFAKILKDYSQSIWQILPVTPTSRLKHYSPYASISAFAGNTMLINPLLLYEENYLKKEDFLSHTKDLDSTPESDYVDFRAVMKSRETLLNKAFLNFQDRNNFNDNDFQEFCQKHEEEWLDSFSIFNVLKRKYKNISWSRWPDEIKKGLKIIEVSDYKMNIEILKEKFLQFVFFQQWLRLKKYCNSIGLKIIGDIPIYMDYESSDVWSNPEIFKLDKNKKPEFVSGVPPDYYSATGQLWNNPVYNWENLKKENYRWWLKRIMHNLELFDYVRLDHFRGFVKYWEVKAGEKTAKNGKWQKAEPEDFFRILRGEINGKFKYMPIIAEDLGYITYDVIKVMKKNKFPGIRVILFAFGKDFPYSIHLPENYDDNCIAYTGTHDNNTVYGFVLREAKEYEKKNIIKYLKLESVSELNNISMEFIKRISSSKADLTIFPVQDILGFDHRARMNKPSTKRKNWRWKLKSSDLNIQKFEELKNITERNKRI